MIDINELRDRAVTFGSDYLTDEEWVAVIDRLEAAEKSDAESLAMYRKARDERDAHKAAFEGWHQKTEWVQQGINDGSVPPTYLGWHRADVMTDMLKSSKKLIEELQDERDALRAAVRHEADCVEAAKAEITALCAKIEQTEQQEPVFWWRPCSDGTYEGPLHNNSIERVRKQSGAWSPLYALPGAQQCKNCNGMGDRFDPSGEKIPCDLCESHLEEIRSLVAEAVHDIISGSDFWLSISLAAKKLYAIPGATGEEK